MLQFKEMGIKRYDWGGLFEDESIPENAGINKFKKDFGGQQVRTYDCTVPVTLKGRICFPFAMPGGVENPRTLKQRLHQGRIGVDRPEATCEARSRLRPQGHLGDNGAVVDCRILGPGETPQSRFDPDGPVHDRGIDEHDAILKIPAPDPLTPPRRPAVPTALVPSLKSYSSNHGTPLYITVPSLNEKYPSSSSRRVGIAEKPVVDGAAVDVEADDLGALVFCITVR